VLVHDPVVTSEDAQNEYGLPLTEWSDLTGLDAVVLAVPHDWYQNRMGAFLSSFVADAIFVDVKRAAPEAAAFSQFSYWSL
jgi:UDP-N-acetyl-D-glucosamine/UDP-N-acetyl-D-galactosamine dehydrogenase